MKKFAVAISVMLLSFLITGAKAENECFKISYNGEVKAAKNIGAGYGISFTLPDTDETEYYISAIELAVFKKGENDTHYSIYTDGDGNESKRKVINNPSSLTVQVEFGDMTDYEQRTKYKLAYRYYMTNINDISQTIIAGEGEKDGWRLIGESNPLVATDDGFSFYLNSTPNVSLTRVEYTIHKTVGNRLKRLVSASIESTYLPKDAFANGLTVLYRASDFDDEDTVSVTYTLSDKKTGKVISSGSIANAGKIYADVDCDAVSLVLKATDSFGAYSNSEVYTINIDRELPEVVWEFDDNGYYIKGLELFSDFEISEDLADDSVLAKIYKGDDFIKSVNIPKENDIYRLKETMDEEGEYTVELYLEDIAGNLTVHNFLQKLDNVSPLCTVITNDIDEDATEYEKWTNESKKIIIDASDSKAGVSRYILRLNSSLIQDYRYPPLASQRLEWNVSETETGKLEYTIKIYDNAKRKNETYNIASSAIAGNYTAITKYVWIDKTSPVITVNHNDIWHQTGYSVSAVFEDLPSKRGKGDDSGIKEKQYAITETNSVPTEWTAYTTPVVFNEGGVYYLHFRAEDNAGNETLQTVRVRINNSSHILGYVTPTSGYAHTIYYSENGFYVVKNTAYNTKYHFELEDEDINDTINAEIKLVSRDDDSIFAKTTLTKSPTGEKVRDIEFNLQYFDSKKDKLPDGLYDMLITIHEVKSDGQSLMTYDEEKGCEVVIKRNAPPTPIIAVSDGYVKIEYPEETLAYSLNSEKIKSKYLRQYKAVKSGEYASYRTYQGTFPKDNMTVTALYTDIAGNTSTASMRIFAETTENHDKIEIAKDGNDATVEETRSATVYYIGIRREKQTGINSDVFGFMNR